MTLRLYADECVDARIVAGLRRRGIDIVTAAEEDLLGAHDDTHLQRASELDRVVVSNDQDFLRLAHQRAEGGADHPGLLFILPRTPIGNAVRSIALVSQAKTPEDLRNWIEWIG